MRILLTGADGFTGRHFQKMSNSQGCEVIALKTDLTNKDAVNEEIHTICPSHVLHLAAISSVTHASDEEFYKVNLFGTINLLDALKNLPVLPKKIILASSANVYGNTNIDIIGEKICPKPVNHYAMSKLAMEHMTHIYNEFLQIIIARPFNYTGVYHDSRFVIPKIVEHLNSDLIEIELGNLNVYREYNDVRMVCDVYYKLLNKGVAGEIYNVCSGNAYSLLQIIDIAERISGKRINAKSNSLFMRSNEVFKLVGDPKKLIEVVGELEQYPIEETLSWMLGLKI
jgi:nucleoside-diphosphate-sugar epimerase